MLQTVDVGKRSLAACRGVAPDTILDDLTRLAETFRGARVVHINATPYGQVSRFDPWKDPLGLVVSEAMWKGTPVVAGRAGGIPLQMADGAGGLLVESVEACAKATLQLLKDSGRAGDLARRGRERVKEYFLTPRLLLNHLSLLLDLSKGRTRPMGAAFQQDPVCGMVVEQPTSEVATARGWYVFCSEECRRRFQTDPARYLGQAA